MAAAWLYKIDANGVSVTPEFMERLRRGDATALRSLNQQKLSLLYRMHFSRESKRADVEGFFWSTTPPLSLIPIVRGGRHSPPAWVKDDLLCEVLKPRRNTLYRPDAEQRAERSVRASAKFALKQMKRGDRTVLVRKEGGRLRAWNMKPNPKFDLVVVNRHDRAALLKLLSELDSTEHVRAWLAARTQPVGATLASALHADYSAWCAIHSEVPTGTKSFAQDLVAVGVSKLKRSKEGERYGLSLR